MTHYPIFVFLLMWVKQINVRDTIHQVSGDGILIHDL